MKTPDEFKKNLIACMDEAIEVAENGDAHDLMDFAHHAHARMSETLTYIQHLESSYSQVSKVLCGKENTTLEEILQAVDQVKQNKPGEKLICQITIPTADALLKAVEEVKPDGKTLAEWMELVKGYKQQRWISVKDRLPGIKKDGALIQITETVQATDGKETFFGHFKIYKPDKSWTFVCATEDVDLCVTDEITRWIPLHDLPKEDTNA